MSLADNYKKLRVAVRKIAEEQELIRSLRISPYLINESSINQILSNLQLLQNLEESIAFVSDGITIFQHLKRLIITEQNRRHISREVSCLKLLFYLLL